MSIYNSYIGSTSSSKEEEVFRTLRDIINDHLRDRMLQLKGLIFEAQKKTSEVQDYDSSTYTELNSLLKEISSVKESLQTVIDELQYCESAVNALKASQELTDGYKDHGQQDHRDYLLDLLRKAQTTSTGTGITQTKIPGYPYFNI